VSNLWRDAAAWVAGDDMVLAQTAVNWGEPGLRA
jgi:hypothetical protein